MWFITEMLHLFLLYINHLLVRQNIYTISKNTFWLFNIQVICEAQMKKNLWVIYFLNKSAFEVKSSH